MPTYLDIALNGFNAKGTAGGVTTETSAIQQLAINYAASLKDGNTTLLDLAPSYIKAILKPGSDSFPRLECPAANTDRYGYLRSIHSAQIPPKYFLALNLHQRASLLPLLIGSILQSIRFLGAENCVLSIVEGRSNDGTYEVLKLLRKEIEGMGATYLFKSIDLDPTAPNVDRVGTLAELRNQALEPLTRHPDQFSPDTTVVFLNDVAICMEDILELIHQRIYQKADMTCAMDWVVLWKDPTFYDVWVARGINGDTFNIIPEDGNWNSAWNLFWNDPNTLGRFQAKKPFQVFACWNGATAFTAKPILEQSVRFRGPAQGECYQGEPTLFCKDMWQRGFGKIAVVPSINLEYADHGPPMMKGQKGYVSDLVKNEDGSDASNLIEWDTNPPPLVKCMPSYSDQTWRAWNESLPSIG